MHRIEADTENNLLLISLSGLLTGDEANRIRDKILERIKLLQEGFSIINDMSQFRLGNKDAILLAEKVFKEIRNLGVHNIIRVIGNSQNAVIQSAAATKNVENYDVKYVSTLEEAYKLLGIPQK